MPYKFPYNKNNGVFRYLYRLDNQFYLSYLSNISSSDLYKSEWNPYNALIYDDNGAFWLSDPTKNTQNYLSFCFRYGLFMPLGYEITASNGTSLPEKWKFSGSKSGNLWENSETVNYSIPKSESYFVKWEHGPYNCFRLDTLKRQIHSDASFDVAFLELFGTYYLFDETSNLHYFSVNKLYIFTFISLLYTSNHYYK